MSPCSGHRLCTHIKGREQRVWAQVQLGATCAGGNSRGYSFLMMQKARSSVENEDGGGSVELQGERRMSSRKVGE